MNIDPLSTSGHLNSTRLNGRSPAGAGDTAAQPPADRLSAELSSSVRDTLAALPEIRPEVVERGRQLLADPSYPGPEIVEKIAALITPLPED